MASERKTMLVLTALVAMTLIARLTGAQASPGTWTQRLFWDGFLVGMPVALAGLLAAGQRWALMAAVMYGTIGLALDISTIVQEITKTALPQTVVLSAITGLLNFLLIAIGGRGFLDVVSRPSPPARRPPNLQSR
ncbi:MAG TPA: hypothetical protein VJ692_06110 [Nitrospiraceae bacterium]|nr:hypothetical protein [Nitrospiraceae bacterium]